MKDKLIILDIKIYEGNTVICLTNGCFDTDSMVTRLNLALLGRSFAFEIFALRG